MGGKGTHIWDVKGCKYRQSCKESKGRKTEAEAVQGGRTKSLDTK